MDRLTPAEALREVAEEMSHNAEYNVNRAWKLSPREQAANNRLIRTVRELQARADELERAALESK